MNPPLDRPDITYSTASNVAQLPDLIRKAGIALPRQGCVSGYNSKHLKLTADITFAFVSLVFFLVLPQKINS